MSEACFPERGDVSRRTLMHYVRANPGANFRAIVRATGLVHGTTAYHLSVLVRTGMLIRHKDGVYRRYFARDDPLTRSIEVACALAASYQKELHGFIRANPGLLQRAVIDAFEERGWPRSTTQNRLRRLRMAGAVVAQPAGRRAFAYVAAVVA